MTTIHFIGCGRVGKTFAKLIHLNHLAMIGGVVNQNLNSAQNAVEFIGGGKAYGTVQALPPADIIFITPQDSKLETIVEQLLQAPSILANRPILVHCSGAFNSDVFSSTKQYGCLTASIHPIKSFADAALAVPTFKGTYCSFEGDVAARAPLAKMITAMGGIVFDIASTSKIKYHAAMVIANNYATTLHYHAVQLFNESGVDSNIAKQLVSKLMQDALDNLQTLEHSAALTGPLQRGDTETIKQHLATLSDDKIASDLYKSLARATLNLTNHNDDKLQQLKKIILD